MNIKDNIKKCLIWGTGIYFRNNIRLIKYYEQLEEIKIIGVTSNDSFYDNILNYPFIKKSDIPTIDFDILIIMAEKKVFLDIKKEAIAMGINEYNIIPINVISLPGFTFDKYISIKKSIPTIFSPNCWGGVTYNSLGLEFKSPLINMYMSHNDYIKFLSKPLHYINSTVVFYKNTYSAPLKQNYPIGKCDDILLHFNHYNSFDEALSCWNRRKSRIDWNNLFVMYYDDNKERLDIFNNLSFDNKICFVPYETNIPNYIGINYKKNGSQKPFHEIVNGTATGSNIYYDVFDLILHKKFTPLAQI